MTVSKFLKSTHPWSIPEDQIDPPEATPNPQIERPDYEYATPQSRRAAAEETIMALTECALSLRFLDLSDPENFDNFREVVGQYREFDSFEAIERIKALVAGYTKDKVDPFIDEPTPEVTLWNEAAGHHPGSLSDPRD
jgi:hypothetical protein